MASHTHAHGHAKGGSDLKIAFTALVGGLLWILAVSVVAHFIALGGGEEAEGTTTEAAH